MANDKFRANFAKVISRANVKPHTLIKKVTFDLARSLIARSPVDTGRFKNNWMPGEGTVNTSLTDSTTGDALGKIGAAVGGWNVGKGVFYISNSLPYARRLEYGWSDQAPQGMVRLTVQRFKDHVRKAAEEMK